MFDPWLVLLPWEVWEGSEAWPHWRTWVTGDMPLKGTLGPWWHLLPLPASCLLCSEVSFSTWGHHHDVQPQHSTEPRIQNWNSEAMNQYNPFLPVLFQSAFGRTSRSGTSELLLSSVLVWRAGETVAVVTSEKDNTSVKRAFAVLQITHREPPTFPAH